MGGQNIERQRPWRLSQKLKQKNSKKTIFLILIVIVKIYLLIVLIKALHHHIFLHISLAEL